MPVPHIPSSYTHLLVVIAVLFLVNLSSFSMCVIASVNSVSYFSFFNIQGTGSYTLFCILSFNKVSRIFLSLIRSAHSFLFPCILLYGCALI